MTTMTASERERLSRLEGAYEHLATKADVESVRADVERLRADLERVRAELKADVERVRADVERVRAEMQAMETRLMIRLGGIVSVAAAVIVAVQKLT